MTKNICIIPARMGSSRFPGKPMQEILGKPMIEHVYKRTKLCKSLSDVFVATCDKEIYDFIISIGGNAVMTSNVHERASDRCGEAIVKIESKLGTIFDVMVMVQGDEPMINPEMIDQAINPMFSDKKIKITNLMGEIKTNKEFKDTNCIKVVVDKNNDAIYFSREPIPTVSKGEKSKKMKQICVIPFERNFLVEYNNMTPTPLEISESVDMLRILEHGQKVRMIETYYETFAVDEPRDILKVENLMKMDPITNSILN